MDKSLFIFILIGAGAIYLVTNFVGDIQSEEDAYKNNTYKVEHKYDKYHGVDSVGRPILIVKNANKQTQMAAWHTSVAKVEFLELFPNYIEMKQFVKERVRGDILEKKLLHTIDNVEGKFFSGFMNAEQAKRTLDSLE